MAEEKQVPENADQVQDAGTQLREARSSNKVLKIVASVLAVLFLLMAGSAFYIYRRIARTKAALEEVFSSMPAPFQQAGQQPGAMPQQGFAMFGGGGGAQSSSLNLVSGSVPGGQLRFSPEQGERVHKAMLKYAERPIVKEFMADLKKNPDMAKAFAQAGSGANPMEVIAAVRNAKGMEALVARYAYRPEFLSLMMEVMKDPEIKPLLGGIPGGIPQGQAPSSAPAPESSLPVVGGGGDGSPMVLDTSVVSGGSSEPAAGPKTRRVPPPVDTE